jgi:hypothetical protein
MVYQQTLNLMMILKVENPFWNAEKIKIILDKMDIPCEPFDDRYEIYDLHGE